MKLTWQDSEDLPLATRVARAAFAMTMLAALAIGGTMVALDLVEIPDRQAKANENSARVIGEVLSSDIEGRLNELRHLSESPLVWTSLTDTSGREAYLKPLLFSHANDATSAPMVLLDYKGRRLLGDISAMADPGEVSRLAATVQAERQPRHLVTLHGGKAVMLAAFPVLFPYTHEPIGALAEAIDLTRLFEERVRGIEGATGVQLAHEGRVIARRRAEEADRYLVRTYALPFSKGALASPLVLDVHSTSNPFLVPVLKRLALAALIAFLLGALVWRAARVVSRRVTSRLERLARDCGSLLEGGRSTIDADDSRDEIGVLSRALSAALMQYEHVHAHLEELVREKTRQVIEGETRYRTLFERSRIPMLLIDPASGEIVASNPSAQAFYGYTEEQLSHMPIARVNQLSPREIAHEMALSVAQKRDCFYFPHRLADGRVRQVEVRSGPITVDGRELLYSVVHDITERRAAEKAVDAEKARFAGLLETAIDGIHVLDVEGNLTDFSPSFAAMLGYPPLELAGSHVSRWDARIPEDEIRQKLRRILDAPLQFETVHRRSDGSVFDVEINARGFEIDGRQFVYASSRDITQRKQAEAELERHRNHLEELVTQRTAELAQSRDAAEAANRAKSAFLATMSHELRTPMNGIMGMTNLALGRASDPKVAEWLRKSLSAANQLLAVINDILDISRIEADRLVMDELEFSLREAIGDALHVHEDAARAKGLELVLEIDPALPDSALGDAIRLKQVLHNFVSNAVKFSDRGRIDVRARAVEPDARSVLLRLEVVDQGIGIGSEQAQRLFLPFTQVDGSLTRKYGGAGLGLSIARRLAKMMGGDVGFHSLPGEGSTFWATMRLKRAMPRPHAMPVAAEQATRKAIQERFAGARVLVAEDEPVNQAVAVTLLQDAGLAVDTADDGRQAVDRAGATAYDLILMDMQMPVLNGLDAVRAIRLLPGHSATPILAMTANAFAENRDQCLAVGMNEHLAKPVSPDVLYAAILKWLARREG